MIRLIKSAFIVALIFVLTSADAGAIVRVTRTLNVIDFYGGYAYPWGNYEGTIARDFLINNRLVDVEAENLYEPTFYLGFNYGTLRRGHLLYQLGFRYTNHRMLDTVYLPFDTVYYFGFDYSYRQYDFDFNLNYMVNNLNLKTWSPYVGVGFHAGFTSLSAKGYDAETEIEMALSVNYGLDVKIWKMKDNQSFIALSSINNFNFWASEDRPKYLNFGVGLKYYFRM